MWWRHNMMPQSLRIIVRNCRKTRQKLTKCLNSKNIAILWYMSFISHVIQKYSINNAKNKFLAYIFIHSQSKGMSKCTNITWNSWGGKQPALCAAHVACCAPHTKFFFDEKLSTRDSRHISKRIFRWPILNRRKWLLLLPAAVYPPPCVHSPLKYVAFFQNGPKLSIFDEIVGPNF